MPKRQHVMMPDEINRIAELHGQGLNAYQIAAEMGRGRTTVEKYLRKLGLTEFKPFKFLTATEIDSIVELYGEGLTGGQIARKLGRSRSTVQRIVVEKGLAPRRDDSVVGDAVVELHREGLDVESIAQRLNVCERTVHRWLVRRGVRASKPARKLSPAEIDRAKLLLEDGVSYHETARTLGCAYRTVERALPGFAKKTPRETAELAALARSMNRLK